MLTKHCEKARWELLKNAMCCLEQILEATPHKTAAVWQPISHLINQIIPTNDAGFCWRNRDKLIGNVLLALQCVSAGQPAQVYFHQLCGDTKCNLEDIPRVMDDWDGC